jgi:acyl-CoA synthetase (AMP-forming)/AMP-acid ligase II
VAPPPAQADVGGRFLSDAESSGLASNCDDLIGQSVVIATQSQLAAALTLIELDGIAGRLTLCPLGLTPAHLDLVIANTRADAIVTDGTTDQLPATGAPTTIPRHIQVSTALGQRRATSERPRGSVANTEWILLTSGATSAPKLVRHTLASLAGPIGVHSQLDVPMVWSTFYDIRRYGGLQIFLRAMLGGGSLVLTSAGEPMADTLQRLFASRVTHVSGTPSHWRRVLMSGATRGFEPGNVRLSGEIADQALLDRLKALFPAARIAHAFASTEAGVGFEVSDGKEGFPASPST